MARNEDEFKSNGDLETQAQRLERAVDEKFIVDVLGTVGSALALAACNNDLSAALILGQTAQALKHELQIDISLIKAF